MPTLILPPTDLKRLIGGRQVTGADRYDEVWDGVYVMSPEADNHHQRLASKLTGVIDQALGGGEEIDVLAGTNVSDRSDDWTQNYRVPDVAVFLPGNPAEDRESHWLGGPDFAVEVISPDDQSREKFDFYAQVGVRELMLIDRRPWCLELHRWEDDHWVLVGKSDLTRQLAALSSAVLPLTFRLVPGKRRPRVEVTRTTDAQTWLA